MNMTNTNLIKLIHSFYALDLKYVGYLSEKNLTKGKNYYYFPYFFKINNY